MSEPRIDPPDPKPSCYCERVDLIKKVKRAFWDGVDNLSENVEIVEDEKMLRNAINDLITRATEGWVTCEECGDE